jgi:hypothetical protein
MENLQIIKQLVCLEKSSNKVLNYINDVVLGSYLDISNEKIVENEWDDVKKNEYISKITNTNSENYLHTAGFISEDGSIWITISKNTVTYDFIEYTGENDPLNQPGNDAIYDSNKNAFIRLCPVEGYILNESTFEWEPDPSITYDLHGDGKQYRYDVENLCWWPTW